MTKSYIDETNIGVDLAGILGGDAWQGPKVDWCQVGVGYGEECPQLQPTRGSGGAS